MGASQLVKGPGYGNGVWFDVQKGVLESHTQAGPGGVRVFKLTLVLAPASLKLEVTSSS